jgi:outer membrane protein assembly factor BamB
LADIKVIDIASSLSSDKIVQGDRLRGVQRNKKAQSNWGMRSGGRALVVLLGLVAATFGQSAADEDAKPSIKKCWEISGTVLPEPGIAADDTQGYFIRQDEKIIGVELASGEVAWSAETGGKIASELVVSNGKLFFVALPQTRSETSRSTLRVLSTKTGLSLWNLELPTAAKYYLSTENGSISVISDGGELWMLEGADGRIRWHSNASGAVSAAPRLSDGRLLVAVDRKRVEEFSVDGGERVGRAEADGIPAFVGAGRSSAAVYSDERGNVHSIKMNGGKNWKFRSGGRVVYIRAVGENVLLGSADNFVYFMNVEYGNLLWKRRLPGRIASGGIVGNDLAAFTVIGERSAFILDLEKGRIVDRVVLSDDDAFLLTPIRANGTYLLAATASGISAFSATCKNQKSGQL